MPPEAVTPPSAEELQSFSLGKCEPGRAAEIESYLDQSTDCSSILDAAPEDDVVRYLRGAGKLPPAAARRSDDPFAVGDAGAQFTLSGPESWELALGDVATALLDHPRYRIIRKLGEGGMAIVYLAEHRLLHRPVALKLIRPGRLADAQTVARFRQEIQAAASLSHPNIATAFDAEEVGGSQLLAMEYVDGVTLKSWLAERGPLPVAEACEYVRQAALGLQHAHDKGLVHRDVKPANLMRQAGADAAAPAVIKIVDFGLARVVFERGPAGARRPAAAGAILGTADYIAPEQARDSASADIRADIYSLGATLYHLLAGRVPFPEGSELHKILRHATTSPRPIAELRGDVPAALAAVIDRMMAKKPADRYQTPAEVAAALAPFGGGGAPESVLRLPPRRHFWSTGRLAAIVFALATLVAVILGLTLMLQQ